MAKSNPKTGDEVEIRTEEKPEWRKVRVLADLSAQFVWEDELGKKSIIGFVLYNSTDWREIPQ